VEYVAYYPLLKTSSDKPYTNCGYYKDVDTGDSMSVCGNLEDSSSFLALPNPTISDPQAFGEITFGKASPRCAFNRNWWRNLLKWQKGIFIGGCILFVLIIVAGVLVITAFFA